METTWGSSCPSQISPSSVCVQIHEPQGERLPSKEQASTRHDARLLKGTQKHPSCGVSWAPEGQRHLWALPPTMEAPSLTVLCILVCTLHPPPSPSRSSATLCTRLWLGCMRTLSYFNFKNMGPAMLKMLVLIAAGCSFISL
jgi:hypothetical protein